MDILTRIGDAIHFDDLESQRVTIEGLEVVVATPKTLYHMKRDTVRAQDAADAAWLAKTFEFEED